MFLPTALLPPPPTPTTLICVWPTVSTQLALVVKNPPTSAGDKRHTFNPWEWGMATLEIYNAWGCREFYMT